MKIGVYVGSFNPIHNGHIKVVNYLLDNKYVDKVLLLATPSYWDKNNLAPIEDRINMLKYFESDNIVIDTIHNNYQYTYEVLNSISKDYKEDELYLIIGSDNIIKFNLWKNLDDILKYKIIVIKRDNTKIEEYTSKLNGDFIIIKDFIPIDISSTKIRDNLDNNNIDDRVLKYIEDHNLYKGE